MAMVLTLVLLPALAPVLKAGATLSLFALALPIAITLGKVAAFVAIMLIVGRRVIPWILHYVAHTGSRELFRLSVLAIALGVAFGAAMLFDVSFALGAFFAGMMLSESELSQRAASETLPLRDAFAVLFFVSVGMLVDPTIVLREPIPLLATVLIIVVGKSLAAFVIVRLFGHPTSTALTIAASLAQIGEFSFILAGLGIELTLLPERGRDLILAGPFFRFCSTRCSLPRSTIGWRRRRRNPPRMPLARAKPWPANLFGKPGSPIMWSSWATAASAASSARRCRRRPRCW
jgi:CPA2 family monovalent cation:H+ antiporter-2